MKEYKEELIVKFFKTTKIKFEKRITLSKSDIRYLFEKSINLLGSTHPNKTMLKYYLHPEIVKIFLFELNNSGLSTAKNRKRIQPCLSSIIKKFPKKNSTNRFVRFRILDNQGNYPNIDFSRDGINYSNINQIPTLLTINNESTERKFSNLSELTWITRKELKAALCIMISIDKGWPLIFFNDYNHIDLNEGIISAIPDELKNYFLLDLIQFKNKFRKPYSLFRNNKPTYEVSSYNYFDIGDQKIFFKELIDKFSIRDQLLLRTSNHFLKSCMLWQNYTFGEESIVNIFIALEGCLHLVQKKFGDISTKLNRSLIKQVFKEEIPRGEFLFDFIEEAYYKRISLVHPEPTWGAEWTPFLMADDFYDYRRICVELLNFILIDRIIEQ